MTKRQRRIRAHLAHHATLIAYAILYATLLLAMHLKGGFGLAEPLAVVAIVGIGFTRLAFWSTRTLERRAVVVRSPSPESRLLMLYSLGVVVFLTWGLPAVRGLASDPAPTTGAGLLAKLVGSSVFPCSCGGGGGATASPSSRMFAGGSRATGARCCGCPAR